MVMILTKPCFLNVLSHIVAMYSNRSIYGGLDCIQTFILLMTPVISSCLVTNQEIDEFWVENWSCSWLEIHFALGNMCSRFTGYLFDFSFHKGVKVKWIPFGELPLKFFIFKPELHHLICFALTTWWCGRNRLSAILSARRSRRWCHLVLKKETTFIRHVTLSVLSIYWQVQLDSVELNWMGSFVRESNLNGLL